MIDHTKFVKAVKGGHIIEVSDLAKEIVSLVTNDITRVLDYVHNITPDKNNQFHLNILMLNIELLEEIIRSLTLKLESTKNYQEYMTKLIQQNKETMND